MLLHDMQGARLDPVAERTTPPIQMPFFLEAAILSRMRSPVTSRSNWAKDSRTFSVSRPIGGRVESLGHRDEGDTMLVEHFHELGEVGERPGQAVDLIDDDRVDPPGADGFEQALQSRSIHRPPEKPPSSNRPEQSPAFVDWLLI